MKNWQTAILVAFLLIAVYLLVFFPEPVTVDNKKKTEQEISAELKQSYEEDKILLDEMLTSDGIK